MWGIREVNQQRWLAEWYSDDSAVPGTLWVECASNAYHTTFKDAKRIADRLYRQGHLALATRFT